MPLIRVYTSSAPPAEETRTLLLRLSTTLSRELNKPESYVMTCLVPKLGMTFAGSDTPACFAVIKNIGEFSPELTTRLCGTLTQILTEGLGVPRDRVYLEFQEAKPHLWGFNGETFA
jgi:phenylpyruvate tautomerase